MKDQEMPDDVKVTSFADGWGFHVEWDTGLPASVVFGAEEDPVQWAKRQLVNDLASGTLCRFDLESVEAAVDALLEHDQGQSLTRVVADYLETLTEA